MSLSEFCRRYGLAKSTVHKACQDLGIATSNGLNDEAVALLKERFNVFDTPKLARYEPHSGIVQATKEITFPDLLGTQLEQIQSVADETNNTSAINNEAARRFADMIYKKGLVDGMQLKAELQQTSESLKNLYMAGMGGGLSAQDEQPKKRQS